MISFKCSQTYWHVEKAYLVYGATRIDIPNGDKGDYLSLPNVVTLQQAIDRAQNAVGVLSGMGKSYKPEVFEISASNDNITIYGNGFVVQWVACNQTIGD